CVNNATNTIASPTRTTHASFVFRAMPHSAGTHRRSVEFDLNSGQRKEAYSVFGVVYDQRVSPTFVSEHVEATRGELPTPAWEQGQKRWRKLQPWSKYATLCAAERWLQDGNASAEAEAVLAEWILEGWQEEPYKHRRNPLLWSLDVLDEQTPANEPVSADAMRAFLADLLPREIEPVTPADDDS
ncbi:MAG: hypothetical protein AAFR76_15430, partial [Planctomycetota bacterium]